MLWRLCRFGFPFSLSPTPYLFSLFLLEYLPLFFRLLLFRFFYHYARQAFYFLSAFFRPYYKYFKNYFFA